MPARFYFIFRTIPFTLRFKSRKRLSRSTLDHSIARLREKVKASRIENDTVWIVTSGNGGLRYEWKAPKPVANNSPARSGKRHAYEGGVRYRC